MVTLWTSCLNSIGATWAGWKSKQRARGVHCKCFALVHIARSRGRRNLSQPPKSHSVSCVLRMKCLHRSSPEVRRELAARVFHELMRPSFFLVFLIDFSNLIIVGFYLWLFDFSKQLGLFLWQEWGSSFIIQSAGDHSVILQLFLLLQEQSVSSKAADKTPVGHYFRQVSRKFKNVGFWLIFFFFCLFWHFIPYSLNVCSYIICLFQYLLLSCVLMVIFILLQPLTQLPQELLSEQQSFTSLSASGGSHI